MEGDALKIEEHEFVAEIKQLLDIIVNSIYTHPEIFIRELISNSSDALHKMRFKILTEKNIFDPEAELRINISVDSVNNTFTIEDSGIGMTKEEIINQLGTIASSGTKKFLDLIKHDQTTLDLNLIGKFGVGFYSVFMVTDNITVETRSYLLEANGIRWVSDGKGKYTIETIEKHNRGTKVFFTLKNEHKEFSDPQKVKSIIRKYSNFIEFPIFVNGEKINTIQAIWHKKKEDLNETEVIEFYKFLTNETEPPLHYFQINVEGSVSFKSLLFIPNTQPKYFLHEFFNKTLHLFSNRVFIQDDNQEILPDYLKFIRGVLDTEDLPLNISRETIQNNITINKIRQILTTRILAHLSEFAENHPEKYNKFFELFGQILKSGITIDFASKDKIIEMLRFKTTKTSKNEFISLKDYINRMLPEQKEIYYALIDKEELVEKNPNFEYFKKNNIEVLLMTDPIDVLIMPYLSEYDGKILKSIDKSDVNLPFKGEAQDDEIPIDKINKLFERFKSTLGDKILNVQESKRLVESPATLVSSPFSLDLQSEKVFKLIDKDFKQSPKILEINTNNQLIKNLITLIYNKADDQFIDLIINQIFESALLLDGQLENSKEFVIRMNELMTEFTSSRIKSNL